MKPSLLGIVLASFASGGQAVELDCKNTRTGIERMICADADLTLLDQLLMYTYDGEYTRLTYLDESPATANVFERGQLEWLKTQRDRCPDSACLKEAYRERVAAIDGVTPAGYPDAPQKGDFNFDGYEDFALYNGRYGPYGSQTYNVYLYSPAKKTYVLDESFSDLTFGSLNFFEIDAKRKRLVTFSKDGCCYHYDTAYVVRDNRPVPVLRTSREYKGSYELVTVEKFVGGKWKTTKRYRNQCQPA